MTNHDEVHCPTCGAECVIGGDDKEGTHYYIPVHTSQQTSELVNECRFAEINLINLDDVGLFKTFGLCKKWHMVRASKLERILARY